MRKHKATLVIMAAGIGSRFGGGIKQLEPVGPNGEIIVDYSIYDAMVAGFDKVVFVIRKDLEDDFKEVIGNRISQQIEVAYVYQEVSNIPSPYYDKFKDRTKPWGTGQAILACKDAVNEPFLVINADDYYGRDAYKVAYDYLVSRESSGLTKDEQQGSLGGGKTEIKEYISSSKTNTEAAVVSFILRNTLSDFGTVTRGICEKNNDGYLESIIETRNIGKRGDKAVVIEEHKEREINIDSLVSMNMWCFFPEFFYQLEAGFEKFLSELISDDGDMAYLKSEYLLPTIVGGLLDRGELSVKVLKSKDRWFGVTYKEDKGIVIKEIQKLIESGLYV
jgi:hypothetical protein